MNRERICELQKMTNDFNLKLEKAHELYQQKVKLIFIIININLD